MLYKYFTYLLNSGARHEALLDGGIGNFADDCVHAEIVAGDPLWLKIRDRLVFAVQYCGAELFDVFDGCIKMVQ